MPPVLSTSRTNYDYDYDVVQPYFLDGEEEDFYLPVPGKDIWKKFELLPTPPLSPNRSPSSLSAADHLAVVSELLDEDYNPSAALLQSFVIQDCMWSSSFAAAAKLEKVVSERLATLRARNEPSSSSSKDATEPVGDQQASTGFLQDLQATAANCIDPSMVFPCTPLSEKSSSGAAMEAASELCLESPPLSSSDSESEDEGEDEEVDVVTVDRRRASPLVLKRSHVNVHQHNYAAQQPSAVKRLRVEAARPSGGRRCCSPRSDGEGGEDRRRTHNVLERQRRNELKMSFAALRDEVPAVADNEKAAKVVILKKAAEFVAELEEDERRLLTKKDELRKRSRELKLRLRTLQ